MPLATQEGKFEKVAYDKVDNPQQHVMIDTMKHLWVNLGVLIGILPAMWIVDSRLDAIEAIVLHTMELNVQLAQEAQDAMDAKQLEYDSIIDNLPEGIWQ